MIQNPLQIIQEFNKFRQTFTGNPEEEVKKLIASGRINQSQLNELQNMASQFQQMLKTM